MISQEEIKKIKELSKEFFEKMTIEVSDIEADFSVLGNNDIAKLRIRMDEPQILIGEAGQTLAELQRILKLLFNKKLQKLFYLDFDINGYKEKKADYLRKMAKDLADEVALTKEEKVLLPMPAFERRIIHSELSKRTDITTESQGEGEDRHVVIKPR